MHLDFLIGRFEKYGGKDAVVWKDRTFTYRWLADRVVHWLGEISKYGAQGGEVAVLEGDFSPNGIALLLALLQRGCIVVPLTRAAGEKKKEYVETAQEEISFILGDNDQVEIQKLPQCAVHPFYDQLREAGHPGLVLFSSGSTGKSKAIVHDAVRLLEKFKLPGKSLCSVSFLLYDHIGGFNTLLYTLSSGGCLVTLENRSPDAVLAAVEMHKVELLPTSPTLINLILFSEAYKRHNLNSLKLITYGTEPMPESTLKRFHELFPRIRLQQTYGLSELGILRSRSDSSDSLWMKIGGEGFETRVVDGILHIRAKSAMLGYLNAPSAFTQDGWFNTGDLVEVNGDSFRILGRKSEIINVGGEKVLPVEVEDVLYSMGNVAEATVYGEKNPIMGSIVCARVTLLQEEDSKAFVPRLKKFCAGRLQNYKVPVKVEIVKGKQHTERFKKIRNAESGGTVPSSSR